VFANHFSGEGLEHALELYRSGYMPSERHPSPQTILTLNAVVADTADEAAERALPQLRSMARLRLNRPMRPLETVDEALAAPRDSDADEVIARMRPRWVIDEPDAAASAVRILAERHGIDEVMLAPVAGSRADEPADAAPGRVRTLELLAERLAA
jgi:alkanesulfonate monooxygenase SsuD/methylene tetrahydromethanopterin reductase-like flavin-dependent oxidoreductase (luciferase family)